MKIAGFKLSVPILSVVNENDTKENDDYKNYMLIVGAFVLGTFISHKRFTNSKKKRLNEWMRTTLN